MLDEKRLTELSKRMKQYLADKIVLTRQKVDGVDFFLRNSEDSLTSARCLFDVSTKKNYLGYEDMSGFLWVINASYYSMFYMARALLNCSGIKLKSEVSIHSLTFDTLVFYFYMSGKLQKTLFEYYAIAKEDASELLSQHKAEELISAYFYEKEKRASFTYQTGEIAMKSKAQTSLERATKFNLEIRRMIKSN